MAALGGYRKCLVVVGICENGPIRWYHAERKPYLYYARRSYFAPISDGCLKPPQSSDGGGAGYRPRVRYAYSVKRLSP